MKILIIEDSAEVAEAVSLCLELRWPKVSISTAVEGNKGIETLRSTPQDIVILDLNLPDMDGFEVLSQIRSFSTAPVIILTVRDKEDDRAKGLEIGADDYITKPFSPRELIARVNAVMRRASITEATGEQPYIARGNVSLNLTTDEVHIGNQVIKLTPTECKLLYILMKNADQTLSSERISQDVWGKENADTESIRTYVRRLRDKLNDNPPHIILTEHGEGYRFISYS